MEYLFLQNTNEAISVDVDLGTGDAGPVTLKAVKSANYTIYVQRVRISVTTFSAKTLTVQDSAGSAVKIGVASIPATEATVPGEQIYSFDFGPRGTALTQGKDLQLAVSGAGAAARVHVEGYQKQTAVTYA